ncbi:gibberellin-regulated protein 1-like [Argentina anserina]|uniref:gibberellin-regulated protein 1-like n=1 Tax=Argentina anserina TaxID=57926 RepID=UPI0021767430|nr:gibberellin-regulated protein 1-like [Potentilla anserina]
MMNSRLVVASVLLMMMVPLLVFSPVEADGVVNKDTNHASLLDKIDCGGACTARCRLSSRPRLCKRACGTCCQRCSCVPPGTAGNYDVCPCYASLTTHGGRRKCP